MISPCSFFHFLKILFFQVVSGVKGQKMVQNDKNFSLLHSISQVFFSFFQNFVFSWLLGGEVGVKGSKSVHNDKKICPSHSISQKRYMIVIYGAHL